MNYYYRILVTGCSSGLGKALFNEFCRHDHLGAFAHYRSNEDPYALHGDITEESFPDKLDEYLRECEIDCFINNAGVLEGKVIETNLIAQIKMLQVVYNYFLEKQKGKIININSVAGLYHSANESIYCLNCGTRIDQSSDFINLIIPCNRLIPYPASRHLS